MVNIMMTLINFVLFWVVVISILIPVAIGALIATLWRAGRDKRELNRYRRMEKKAYRAMVKRASK